MPNVAPLPQLVAQTARPIAKLPKQPTPAIKEVPKPPGPVIAISNPEYLLRPNAKEKDTTEARRIALKKDEINRARLKGVNVEILTLNVARRRKRRSDRAKEARKRAVEVDELESGFDEGQGDCKCAVGKAEAIEKGPKLKSALLQLSEKSIKTLLTPFCHLSLQGLEHHSALRPYVSDVFKQRKVVSDHVSSDEEGELERLDNIARASSIAYPLSQKQQDTIRHCRSIQVIEFTSLPSFDAIMRLINITMKVTLPFYGIKLFPNVKKVIYSSTLQLKSLQLRHNVRSGSALSKAQQVFRLPHPITFALDWLVDEFSLCIHSPCLSDRSTWIKAQVRQLLNQDTGRVREVDDVEQEAQAAWSDLEPLSGTISLDDLPNLTRLVYHNVLPGDKPLFRGNINTTIYFGKYADPQGPNLGLKTIQSISEMYVGPGKHHKLKLVNLEYLEYPTTRPAGPKMRPETETQRQATRGHLIDSIVLGRGFDPERIGPATKKWLLNAFVLETDNKHHPFHCEICQEWCRHQECGKCISAGFRDEADEQETEQIDDFEDGPDPKS